MHISVEGRLSDGNAMHSTMYGLSLRTSRTHFCAHANPERPLELTPSACTWHISALSRLNPQTRQVFDRKWETSRHPRMSCQAQGCYVLKTMFIQPHRQCASSWRRAGLAIQATCGSRDCLVMLAWVGRLSQTINHDSIKSNPATC